ncbi:DUF805 domain-containing protein [Variovorax sp.]|uniref:DUF805 domain-containing protein n=1 Tax=Variovorax sp. TaxID=1871043 RepID=UPI002D6D6906|nr:DUF805 domain-containing protein [Variovorax sp.]HYP82306.1 DUF805 domain-containing protein [Variovorax sp.]
MNFTQAVQVCLRKYVEFSGRASRSEFWWFALFQLIVLVVAGIFGDRIYGIAALLLLLPSLAAAARRLHDVGKSAWFLLLHFVPIVGLIVLIYFWVQPSQAAQPAGDVFVPPVA